MKLAMKVFNTYINMEKPFSEFLKEYKEKNGKTQREMAQILGISERMYNYYEKGDYDGNPNKVAKYKDKLSGKLRDFEEGTPVYATKATASHLDYVGQVPEVPEFHVNVPGYEDCNFGMYVHGHSMYPTIENGSLILCRRLTDKNVIMYGEIYLIRTADYLMVKRLQKNEDVKHVLCTSDNFEKRSENYRRYEPFELEKDKIIDLYIVKGIIKKTQS